MKYCSVFLLSTYLCSSLSFIILHLFLDDPISSSRDKSSPALRFLSFHMPFHSDPFHTSRSKKRYFSFMPTVMMFMFKIIIGMHLIYLSSILEHWNSTDIINSTFIRATINVLLKPTKQGGKCNSIKKRCLCTFLLITAAVIHQIMTRLWREAL